MSADRSALTLAADVERLLRFIHRIDHLAATPFASCRRCAALRDGAEAA